MDLLTGAQCYISLVLFKGVGEKVLTTAVALCDKEQVFAVCGRNRSQDRIQTRIADRAGGQASEPIGVIGVVYIFWSDLQLGPPFA